MAARTNDAFVLQPFLEVLSIGSVILDVYTTIALLDRCFLPQLDPKELQQHRELLRSYLRGERW